MDSKNIDNKNHINDAEKDFNSNSETTIKTEKSNFSSEGVKKEDQLNSESKKDDEKLDPTHFGDWQVDCRTIDF